VKSNVVKKGVFIGNGKFKKCLMKALTKSLHDGGGKIKKGKDFERVGVDKFGTLG